MAHLLCAIAASQGGAATAVPPNAWPRARTSRCTLLFHFFIVVPGALIEARGALPRPEASHPSRKSLPHSTAYLYPRYGLCYGSRVHPRACFGPPLELVYMNLGHNTPGMLAYYAHTNPFSKPNHTSLAAPQLYSGRPKTQCDNQPPPVRAAGAF